MVIKVSIWSTLEPLLYSKPKHLAEISRELNKPHTTVRKQLKQFEKLGIISKEIIGRLTFYSLRKNQFYIDYLTIIEKEKIISRCREDLLLREIVDYFHRYNNQVIIFGSSVISLKDAKDVDVIVVGRFARNRKIEEFLNVKFHIINVKRFKDISLSLKKEIIKKHLIINGSEEVIRWMIS